MFALPKYSAVISGEVPVETLGITGMLELKEELDEVRENFAAHMLLAICPDVNTNVLNFVGRQRTITTSEVVKYVERNSSSTPVNTTSSFLTAATATETAMYGSKPRNKKSTSYKTRICYVCGQKHMLSQCPTFKKLVPNAHIFKLNRNKPKNAAWVGCQDLTSDNSINGSSELSCVATETPLSKKDWVFDSGCTTHVCCDRSMFSTFMPAESSTISGIAGNAPILGYGRVELKQITLNNVAYIPSMSFNLISIKRASVIANVRFIFDQNSLSVIYPSNKVKQLGTVKNGLYVLDRPSMRHHGEVSYVGSEVLFDTSNAVYDPLLPRPKNPLSISILYHARLGHPGADLFNKLAPVLQVPALKPEKHTLCPTCSLAKAISRKGRTSQTVYSHPLQLLQVDLCGNFRYKNFTDSRYFLTIRDAYSRYYTVIHLKNKSDASDKFIEWVRKTENHFAGRGGYKVGAVRTDNGGEFVNDTLHEFFRERGIEHQLTVPYTSFQNGAFERAHRSIENKTRCLLIGGRVPPSLWTDAITCAVYLINRLPVPSRKGSIPYCLWNNVSPTEITLEHLRIFGCAAYTTIPMPLRDGKFAPTAIAGVMVGYDSEHKGYRIYHPPSRKVFVSTQVKFDESVFPLEGSNQTINSHEFATSTLKGVPRYPATGATMSGYLGVKRQIREQTAQMEKLIASVEEPKESSSSLRSSPEPTSSESVDNYAPDLSTLSGVNFVKRRQVQTDQVPHSLGVPTELATVNNQRFREVRDPDSSDASGRPVPVDEVYLNASRSAMTSSSSCSATGNMPSRLPTSDFQVTGDYQDAVVCSPSGESESTTAQVLMPFPGQGPSSLGSSSSSSLPSSVASHMDGSNPHRALTAVVSGLALLQASSAAPSTIKQALSGPDADAWRQACQRELQAFKEHNTYELVPLPADHRALGTRWVLTIKGKNMPKARLIAQGHRQIEGIDYTETFAPVVRYDSVSVFLALSACLRLTIHQMDVNTAFLNSPIDETVYVRQPPYFLDAQHPDYVWKLKGAMYGSKQAPLLWNQHINATLSKLGFRRHEGENGLYFKKCPQGLVLVALYVDDLLIAAASTRMVRQVKCQLQSVYAMKDLGPVNKFLGMNVSQTKDYIALALTDYITSAASASEIQVGKPVYSQLSPTTDYNDSSSPLVADVKQYQAIIGQLMFIANTGRPDVAYSVSLLSRFMQAPRKVHLRAAHRVFQYLYTTRTHRLVYRSGSPIQAVIYSDASHGSAADIPYATRGHIVQMAGGTVTWSSKKIKMVTLSSTEAEYVAACEAVKEAAWLTHLFTWMGLSPLRTRLLVDNQPAIHIAQNPVCHSRIKHIRLDYHYIREAVQSGLVDLEYIPTKEQLADITTKVLPRETFEDLAARCLTVSNSVA